jgi:hypothetical protein
MLKAKAIMRDQINRDEELLGNRRGESWQRASHEPIGRRADRARRSGPILVNSFFTPH